MMTFTEAHHAYIKMVRDDLLSRPALAAPDFVEMVETTSGLAGSLGALDISIRAHGCDLADTHLHRGLTDSLLRGLWLMGTAHVEGTVAEKVLVQAMITAQALLALEPTAGTA